MDVKSGALITQNFVEKIYRSTQGQNSVPSGYSSETIKQIKRNADIQVDYKQLERQVEEVNKNRKANFDKAQPRRDIYQYDLTPKDLTKIGNYIDIKV